MVKSFHKNIFSMLEKLNITIDTIKTKQGLEDTVALMKQSLDDGTLTQVDLLNLFTAYKVYKMDNDPIDKLVKAVTNFIEPNKVSNIDKLRQFHQGEQVEFKLDVDETEELEFVGITKDEFINLMIDNNVRGFHKAHERKIVHHSSLALKQKIKDRLFLLDSSSTLTADAVIDLIDKHIRIITVSKVKIT